MLTSSQVEKAAEPLLASLAADTNPAAGRIGKARRYLAGDHDDPYVPAGAVSEYRSIARRSITNWLPIVVDTFTKALMVSGYRGSDPSNAAKDAAPWRYWQANSLDARQTIVHRGAIGYGVAYVLVLPGDDGPIIRPLDPTASTAFYSDDLGDYPEIAIARRGTLDGKALFDLIDAEAVYHLTTTNGLYGPVEQVGDPEPHGLGVCPVVRFRERLDTVAVGVVNPLIPVQDSINEARFTLAMALQYASFRQRWATGLAIPRDQDEFLEDGVTPNPNFGKPVEPFSAAVDRLWVAPSTDARFGDFAQTDVSGHLAAYDTSVRTLVALAQLPPTVMPAQLVNLSAEALSSLESATQRKISEYELLFGEAWEATLRLAALADGDEEGYADTSSQIRWAESEARSLAATVDALGKMVTMLQVPPQALWERIPGVTQSDVEAWRDEYQASGLDAIVASIGRQAVEPPIA